MLSSGSIEIIVAYSVFVISGVLFWLFGPYKLRKDRWFLIAFLSFVIWIPVDIYTISLDIRFALHFNISGALTPEMKELFTSRQKLAPIPMLILLSYMIGIWMAIFKPSFKSSKPLTVKD